MIRYTLRCAADHEFESWFRNSEAYEEQARRKLVACPVCGSDKVEKALMAPRLARTDVERTEPAIPQVPAAPAPASAPGPIPDGPVAMVSEAERAFRQKLRELRDLVVKQADYVGPAFPEEARKIHYGEAERRSIYGEASSEDAKALLDEGIEFHPLPILPDDRN